MKTMRIEPEGVVIISYLWPIPVLRDRFSRGKLIVE